MGRIYAAADIGSNTVHLLVAEHERGTIERRANDSEWISLGEQVARHGHVPTALIQELIGTLTDFRKKARDVGADSIYVFATEAMRSASNHEPILKRIRNELGIHVDLISPRREAELSLRGLQIDAPKGIDLMLEIGGGSAQVARVSGSKLREEISLPVGTGRIIAESGLKSPATPAAIEKAEAYLAATINVSSLLDTPVRHAAANGGVIRGIWRALHRDQDKTLHIKEIEYMEWVSARLNVPHLVDRFDVKQRRAATLYPGAMVYRTLLQRLNVEELFVSEFGVREGAVLEMAKGTISGSPI